MADTDAIALTLVPLPNEPGFYLADSEYVWQRHEDGTYEYHRNVGRPSTQEPRFTTVVPLVPATPTTEVGEAEPSPEEARPSEWDDAVAAFHRAEDLYPDSRHWRDLFQYGARWMRKHLSESGRLR